MMDADKMVASSRPHTANGSPATMVVTAHAAPLDAAASFPISGVAQYCPSDMPPSSARPPPSAACQSALLDCCATSSPRNRPRIRVIPSTIPNTSGPRIRRHALAIRDPPGNGV